MPKQYEAIRDRMVKEGKSYDEAQAHAAAIYNSTHKDNPVTGSHKKRKRAKRVEHGSSKSRSGTGIRDLY